MSVPDERFTIGVEEEYQIIDPLTRELSADVERILPRAQEILGDAIQYELILSQIEVATPICHTLPQVRAELARLRRGVIYAAEQFDRRIAAAGTHPFSHWSEQPITPKERYHSLVSTYKQLIREQTIFGCHVHIGIPDREAATLILSHARLWLAPLLALTANSPFWLGADTGYASYRTGLWWTAPISGPPPFFASRREYDALVATLIATNSVQDATRLYWDIRLPERFATIEFRVMDVCMTLEEAVVIAGLVRALVRRSYEQVLQNVPPPAIATELLRAASWRAARYGLTADLVDVRAGRSLPAHKVIELFLEFVRPALEAEGDWEFVSTGLRTLLHEGNGAARQRAAFKHSGQMNDVVDFIVAQTRLL